MAERSVQDVVKKCLVLANLEHKNIAVHKLRHTAATLMYQYGKVDIRSLQQILGHASIATTDMHGPTPGVKEKLLRRPAKISSQKVVMEKKINRISCSS